MKTKVKILLRIYMPFILTIAALVNIVMMCFITQEPSFSLCLSGLFGGSIFLDIYMYLCSVKMCFYYKMNILCLFLTHLTNILYDYFLFDDTIYLTTIIILLMIGTLCFIIFKRKYIVKFNKKKK